MILASRPGAHLASVACAFPDVCIDREAGVAMLTGLYPGEDPAIVRSLVERSGVDTRYIVPPIADLFDAGDFTRRNERYRHAAAQLAARACREAIERAEICAADVDAIIDVSCTGISIPAIDVALAPILGLRPDVRRIPITESGCAAGALGLGLAGTLASTGMRVLVVAVELCSYSHVRQDRSRANLVASVLFGDAAAAALVLPDGPGPRIAAVGSHLIADSQGTMGFHVGDHGLQIVLQRELPQLLVTNLPRAMHRFLEDHGRKMGDVGLHLIHPGGRKILEAYVQMHALAPDAIRWSRESLRRFGNLSSASILNVLELALREVPSLPDGKEAFVMAIGPGLSLEMLLLDWNGRRA